MAEQSDKLAITPRVIDTGSKVIQLSHVTSAGYGTGHPFRPLGIGLVLLAVVLIGVEVFLKGVGAFTLKGGGSPVIWLAFAAAGIGVFLTVFARRFLVVRTSDGARTDLPTNDEVSAAAVIGRIREAMERAPAGLVPIAETRLAAEHPPAALPHAPPIDTTPPVRTGPPRALPAALPTSGQPRSPAVSDPFAPSTSTPPQHQPGAAYRPEGYVNGHGAHQAAPIAVTDPARGGADPQTQPRRGLAEYVPTRQSGERSPPAQSGAFPGFEASGGPTLEQRLQPPREPLALPAAAPAAPIPRDDPAHDLHLLMEHVRKADLQHKEALLDLLRVVDDHYRGRASREDALAHWRSFADYVVQYLGGVEGLLGFTERFGRHMLPR